MKFKIGDGLTCDLDRLVDTRLLVQANSGGGKSWCLRRILEQTHGRVQHLVIDPEGEFASLREKFDYVHAAKAGADTAADPRAAALLAERLLELNVSAILDIYELKAHERVRFVKLFLDALVNAPKTLWHPALVLVDEAHVYCPEKGEAESGSAVIDLATRGRKRGFSVVLATQRLAKLHKDAAAECNNKLIGRTTLDVDVKRAANELGLSEKDARLILRQLKPGEFFAYGPAFIGEMNDFGVIHTHSGDVRTTHPKAGGHRKFEAPPPTAAIRKLLPDLADLPAEAEERVKTLTDLKGEIAALKRELTQARKEHPAPKVDKRESQDATRALKADLLKYRRALEAAMKIVVKVKAFDFTVETPEDKTALEQAIAAAVKQITGPIEKRVTSLATRVEGIKKSAGDAETAIQALLNEKLEIAVEVQKSAPFQVRTSRPARPPRPRRTDVEANGNLSPVERRILGALAELESMRAQAPEKELVAIFAGYGNMRSKGFSNAIGALRSAGYIDYPSAGRIALTDDGRAHAEPSDVPTTPADVQRRVVDLLGPKAGEILKPLIGAYPEAVAREKVAAAAGYDNVRSKGFANMIGRLRSLGFISYPQTGTIAARPVLFLEEA